MSIISILFYSYITGEKIFSAEATTAKEIVARCGDDSHCAVEAMREISLTKDQSFVVTTLKELISNYHNTETYCHPEAHHLGLFLYGYLGDLEKALSHVDQKCGGAAYHGILQNYFMSQINDKAAEDIEITELCPENKDNIYGLDRWQCFHGIGHGLAAAYDYDVLLAVQRCGEFTLQWEQLSCSKGVFMENMVSYLTREVGDINENDVFFPCSQVEDKYAPACYHYHSSYILREYSVTDSFKKCDEVTPSEFVKYCYHGIGRQKSISVLEDPDRLGICQIGQTAYQDDCFRGMVMTIVNNRDISIGFEFCKTLSEEFKADCYDALGNWIYMMHSDPGARAKECSAAESPKYLKICSSANLEEISML